MATLDGNAPRQPARSAPPSFAPAVSNLRKRPLDQSPLDPQAWPDGPCKFRNLSLGAAAPSCGCERFWFDDSHLAHDDTLRSGSVKCACGHHACFHAHDRKRIRAEEELESVPQPHSELRALNFQEFGPNIEPPATRTTDEREEIHHQAATPSRQCSSQPAVNENLTRSASGRVNALRQQVPSLTTPSNGPVMYNDNYSSRTEPNTPSQLGSPNLHGLSLFTENIETLARIATDVTDQTDAQPDHRGDYDPPSVPSIKNSKIESPTLGAISSLTRLPINDETLALLRTLQPVPSILQRLSPMLTSIIKYMNEHPYEALTSRVEALESLSNTNSPSLWLQDKLDSLESRVVNLEECREGHNQLLEAVGPGPDRRKRQRIAGPAELRPTTADNSFSSNGSLPSKTSSALMSAAINQQELDDWRGFTDQRLSQLESTAPPTLAAPWQVEVVLIPWGRRLKGLWVRDDQPVSTQASLNVDQEPQDWTQVQAQSGSFRSDPNGEYSGWNRQSIQEWAENANEWQYPKACSWKGIAYHRLRSRGFVQEVTFRSGGWHAIQRELLKSFNSSLRHLPSASSTINCQPQEETSKALDKYFGLRGPFIPLRKIHKNSRLQFLSPADMLTPAVWTAEYLAEMVIMRAVGGRKRLFITTPEAYLQPSDDTTPSWTWQKIRELPRAEPSHVSGQQEPTPVQEANAKESCWEYHPNYDSTSSASSSFSGFHDDAAQASRLSESQSYEQEVKAGAQQPVTPGFTPEQPALFTPVSEHSHKTSAVSSQQQTEQKLGATPDFGSAVNRRNSFSSAVRPDEEAEAHSLESAERQRTWQSPDQVELHTHSVEQEAVFERSHDRPRPVIADKPRHKAGLVEDDKIRPKEKQAPYATPYSLRRSESIALEGPATQDAGSGSASQEAPKSHTRGIRDNPLSDSTGVDSENLESRHYAYARALGGDTIADEDMYTTFLGKETALDE